MTNTQTPLWKQLNEQRTQGEWFVKSINIESEIGWNVATINPFAPEHSNSEANAQYTALAVNNLAALAEALERFVNFVDQQKLDYESAMVRAAKEALNRIS